MACILRLFAETMLPSCGMNLEPTQLRTATAADLLTRKMGSHTSRSSHIVSHRATAVCAHFAPHNGCVCTLRTAQQLCMHISHCTTAMCVHVRNAVRIATRLHTANEATHNPISAGSHRFVSHRKCFTAPVRTALTVSFRKMQRHCYESQNSVAPRTRPQQSDHAGSHRFASHRKCFAPQMARRHAHIAPVRPAQFRTATLIKSSRTTQRHCMRLYHFLRNVPRRRIVVNATGRAPDTFGLLTYGKIRFHLPLVLPKTRTFATPLSRLWLRLRAIKNMIRAIVLMMRKRSSFLTERASKRRFVYKSLYECPENTPSKLKHK